MSEHKVNVAHVCYLLTQSLFTMAHPTDYKVTQTSLESQFLSRSLEILQTNIIIDGKQLKLNPVRFFSSVMLILRKSLDCIGQSNFCIAVVCDQI